MYFPPEDVKITKSEQDQKDLEWLIEQRQKLPISAGKVRTRVMPEDDIFFHNRIKIIEDGLS